MIFDMTVDEFHENHQNHVFWDEVVRALLASEKIEYNAFQRFSMGGNIVYSIDEKYVLKLFAPFHSKEFFIETDILENTDWSSVQIQTPRLVHKGNFDGWNYFLMTRVSGQLLIDVWQEFSLEERHQLARDLGLLIKQMHQLDISSYSFVQDTFDTWIPSQKAQIVEHHTKTNLAPHLLNELTGFVESFVPSDEKVLLTGEYTPFNLLVTQMNGKWTLTGLIDFADCFIGDPSYDLLGPILFNYYKEPSLTKAFMESYGFEMSDSMRVRLMQLLLLHRFSHLPNYMSGVIKMDEIDTLHTLSKRFFSTK